MEEMDALTIKMDADTTALNNKLDESIEKATELSEITGRGMLMPEVVINGNVETVNITVNNFSDGADDE